MKPNKSILDESFSYTPAAATAVDATWRRYGWQPVTDQDRNNRRRGTQAAVETRVVALKPLRAA